MTRYWTSDLHFFHKNILDYDERPFGDLDHMHEELIRRWNMVVSPKDEVMVIGDVSFGGTTKTKAILDQMNGVKLLVRGNHDPSIQKCYNMGFDYVYEEKKLNIKLGGQDVIVCHYPYSDPRDNRFIDRRPKDEGGWLIHGHVHTSWKTKDKMINVGCCVWNYAPVSDADLIKIMTDYDETQKQIAEGDAIYKIAEACEVLGWDISFPKDEEVDGMIIGTSDYIEKVLKDDKLKR